MAFTAYQQNMGDIPIMYLPTSTLSLRAGTALVLTEGKLVIAKDGNKPEYISLYDGGGAAVTDGTIVPVEPVYPSTVYETQLSGNLSAVALGSVHNINANGTCIHSASDTGCAKVISFDGKVAGSKVRVVFIEPKSAASAT